METLLLVLKISAVTVGLVLAILAAIILVRALAFRPHAEEEADASEETVDAQRITEILQALIRYKTVSFRDPSLEDDAQFEGMTEELRTLFPNVYAVCELKRFQGRALLYRWKGKRPNAPTVMMAHYDVVPANADAWEKPPFEGIVEDGYVWGRGTLDTKGTFAASLYAADKLIGEGFVPENDIYFAFSGGEEVNGSGARNIVDYFEREGIEPAAVLDEGGAVVENVFPGVSRPCGLIGIAEKGFMDVKYTAKSCGGHASAPKPDSPVPTLARACAAVEAHPFRRRLSLPAAKLFDTLGRHSSFGYRIIFANVRLFLPLLDIICKKNGGELNALLRTTVAFTQMSGSSATNVIPPEAHMVSNIRLNPHDSVESALAYLKKTVGDGVEVTVMYGENPSRVSVTDSEGYERIARAIRSTWKGAGVAPYLMLQCSDSRHWGRISDRVYRFSAMDLTSEDRALIHANNERVSVECLCRACEFYTRLIKSC